MTYAATDQKNVYIERYGTPGKTIYLTVLNDSAEAVYVTIAVDTTALGLLDQEVTELIGDSSPVIEKSPGKWRWKAELNGEEARLYRIGL